MKNFIFLSVPIGFLASYVGLVQRGTTGFAAIALLFFWLGLLLYQTPQSTWKTALKISAFFQALLLLIIVLDFIYPQDFIIFGIVEYMPISLLSSYLGTLAKYYYLQAQTLRTSLVTSVWIGLTLSIYTILPSTYFWVYSVRKTAVDITQQSIKNFEGKEVALSNLKNKVVVIAFWKLNNNAYYTQQEHLRAVREQFKNNKEVVFLDVCTDEMSNKEALQKQYAQNYPELEQIYYDHEKTISDKIAAQNPNICFVDKTGVVRYVQTEAGEYEPTTYGYTILLTKLLKEQKSL
ncbi:MAG: hypothetical protein EAZ55_00370 [Cytophagales bacterium]|nr:MAG: hypothetical protein EAZ55_00370 [Cytophagales bacterium]